MPDKLSRRIRTGLVGFLLVTTFIFTVPVLAVTPPAAVPAVSGWQPTGITLSAANSNPGYCLDAAHPYTVLFNRSKGNQPEGSFAYNWQTRLSVRLNDRLFDICSPTGVLFATEPTGKGQTWRFSLDDPTGQPVAHTPTQFVLDGSQQLFALEKNQIWSSRDGGLSWQSHNGPPGEQLLSMAVVAGDSRVWYAATGTVLTAQKTLDYIVYVSTDSGASWTKSSNKRKAVGLSQVPNVRLATFQSRNVPVSYLQLAVDNGGSGQNAGETVYVSSDSGHSFSEAGKNIYLFERVQVFYSGGNLLRLRSTESKKYSLSVSQDGGRAWQKRELPFTPKLPPGNTPLIYLAQVANLPANLYITEPGGLWFSLDSGQSWQRVAENLAAIQATPYAPLSLVGIKSEDSQLFTLSLPEAAKSITSSLNPVEGTSAYFQPTGHNLADPFRSYWQKNGNLARFGYPKTEAFREVNPSDGKAYVVQYFERNRFEFHPENAGSAYEVLLGLLGNQLTDQRRAQGELHFMPAPEGHFSDGTYFTATGHNLRGTFKLYWERQGGLSVYGYPITEEFEEVNPDDGKTYIVQYFERNRFEYHPDNAGTPYEVLLGLLGNSLLKSKGWL